MTRLTLYLSLCLATAMTPALAAQVTLGMGTADSSAALSMSGPPNLSMSLEAPSDDTSIEMSVEEPSDESPSMELSVEEPSSSEISHMSAPPDFTSSSEPDDEYSDDDSEPSLPDGPPLSSADALKLFVTLCTEVGANSPDAKAHADAAGWIADDPLDSGPYVSIYSGYQEFAGYGSVDVWSSYEVFPSQALGYCKISFTDTDNLIDFSDLGSLGFSGDSTDQGNGNVYGSWESDDKKTMLAADRADGEVQMEFNVLGPAPQN